MERDGIYTQVGIKLFGAEVRCPPAVFTRVSSYLSWISTNNGISIDQA
jgi:secreted trypsin-like serine protease